MGNDDEHSNTNFPVQASDFVNKDSNKSEARMSGNDETEDDNDNESEGSECVPSSPIGDENLEPGTATAIAAAPTAEAAAAAAPRALSVTQAAQAHAERTTSPRSQIAPLDH